MHPELHEIPIYYASSLAKKCMSVYQTYVNAMNEKIRRQIGINNPFIFKHISNLKVKKNQQSSFDLYTIELKKNRLWMNSKIILVLVW